MTQLPATRALLPEIASRLGQLRLMIRGYVCLQGLALAATAVVVVFWGLLAADWLFEPSPTIRIVLLVVGGLIVAAVLVRQIFLRLLVPLSDRSLALLLERRHRELGDRLVTAVELSARSAGQGGFDPRMLQHTIQ